MRRMGIARRRHEPAAQLADRGFEDGLIVGNLIRRHGVERDLAGPVGEVVALHAVVVEHVPMLVEGRGRLSGRRRPWRRAARAPWPGTPHNRPAASTRLTANRLASFPHLQHHDLLSPQHWSTNPKQLLHARQISARRPGRNSPNSSGTPISRTRPGFPNPAGDPRSAWLATASAGLNPVNRRSSRIFRKSFAYISRCAASWACVITGPFAGTIRVLSFATWRSVSTPSTSPPIQPPVHQSI